MRLALDVLEGQNFAWVNHCGVGPCRASAPQLARSSPIIRAACRSLENWTRAALRRRTLLRRVAPLYPFGILHFVTEVTIFFRLRS
jgi:hypothetical protein